MKKLIYFLLFLSLWQWSCNGDPRDQLPPAGTFGKAFEIRSDVTDVDSIVLSDSSVFQITQVRGTIEKYCKGEGCWLTLKNGDNSFILVQTKDKSFILPKNIKGKKAVAEGHFIQNNKKDKPGISFEASGIIISP